MLINLKQVRFPLSVCFIHPLPPAGYSPLSQGESWLQPGTGTHHTDCPPETGWTRSVATEGVDSFALSRFAQVVFNNVQLAFVQDALIVLVADIQKGLIQATA